MKAVLMSIKPQWCEKIASGEKVFELRKTFPNIKTLNVSFPVYIYCTQEKRLLHKFNKGECIDDEHFFEEDVFVRQNTWIRGHLNPNGKVIGEFVCDYVQGVYPTGLFVGDDRLTVCGNEDMPLDKYCLTEEQVRAYIGDKKAYGWHISDLVIYNKPKELSDFKHCGVNYHYNPPITRPPQSWCYVEEMTEGHRET